MNYRHQLSLLSLFCLAAPLSAQGEVDLRTTAKKGASVWLLQEQKQESTIDMGGQEIETSQTTTRTVHVTVKDVDDKGNLVVETKIVRAQGAATMPMGMGDYEFDSATEKPAEAGAAEEDEGGFGNMGAMMKKMQMAGVGKSFTAKVSPYGKVVELTDGVAEIVGDDGAGMMMGGGMGKSTLTQMVETAFGVLTDKPVAVGGKWEHKQKDTDGRMPAEHTVEMTLTKADAEALEITATGTVTKPESKGDPAAEAGSEEEEMARQMMKDMKMKNGKIVGSQKISRVDGFVIEATNTMSMDVEMESPMGEMAMTVKAVNTTKRTTAEAAMAVKKAESAKEPAKEEVVKEAGK